MRLNKTTNFIYNSRLCYFHDEKARNIDQSLLCFFIISILLYSLPCYFVGSIKFHGA